jgi:hypothetical protein
VTPGPGAYFESNDSLTERRSSSRYGSISKNPRRTESAYIHSGSGPNASYADPKDLLKSLGTFKFEKAPRFK